MDVKEKLLDIVKRAAYSCLPSNTKDFHLNMFVTDLLARGVTVQEWISADYPPKENGEYFIYTQDGDIGTAYFKYGRWLAGGCVVTHWMPLPQPPKGE